MASLRASGDIHILELRTSLNALVGELEGYTERIAQAKTEDYNPSWFPDSERLLYVSRRPGDERSKIMIADTENLKGEHF